MLIFAVFLCPMCLMVNAFLGWQVYLMTTNQTSIEFHNNSEIDTKMRHRQGKRASFKHIYGVGVIENVSNFLGSDPWYWLLPTKFEGSDGIHYPTVAAPEVKKFQAYSIEAQLESDGEDEDDAPIMQAPIQQSASYDSDDERDSV